MGVMIKGMEMPSRCDSCRFLVAFKAKGIGVCTAVAGAVYDGTFNPKRERDWRPPSCPLVEVKDREGATD